MSSTDSLVEGLARSEMGRGDKLEECTPNEYHGRFPQVHSPDLVLASPVPGAPLGPEWTHSRAECWEMGRDMSLALQSDLGWYKRGLRRWAPHLQFREGGSTSSRP